MSKKSIMAPIKNMPTYQKEVDWVDTLILELRILMKHDFGITGLSEDRFTEWEKHREVLLRPQSDMEIKH